MSFSDTPGSGFRQNMLDFETVEKMIDDDLNAREEHDATHPFVVAARAFDAAKTPQQKTGAVRAMLEHGEMFEAMHALDENALSPSPKTQKIVNIVRQGVFARNALLSGDTRSYDSIVNTNLPRFIEEGMDADLAAAASLTLDYATLALAHDYPEAQAGLIGYASALYHAASNENFARQADGKTNRQKAVDVLHEGAVAAKDLAERDPALHGLIKNALQMKYEYLDNAGQAMAREHDAKDPIFSKLLKSQLGP